MSAPNMIFGNVIYGKTIGANLTTSNSAVISNAASSGHCYKINTLNITNYSSSAAVVSINYIGTTGTLFPLAGSMNIPINTTLNLIDKTSQYYLEENTSLYAQANVASGLTVTVSYEDIS
jgi:hypothetical protein